MPAKKRRMIADCMSVTKTCSTDTTRKTAMPSSAKWRRPYWLRILMRASDSEAFGAM